MSRPPLQNNSDGMEPAALSGQIDRAGEPDIPAEVAPISGRGRLFVVVIVALLVAVPSVIAAWNWFRSTRTDAYQFQRVDAEASVLVRDLEGMEATDRWIALTALARDADEAGIRASQIGNPHYRIQTLSLLTSTLAKAGAVGAAEASGRQLSELARVLEDSVTAMPGSEQGVRSLEAIAMALSKAGLAEPARAVATRARDEALQIPDAYLRSSTLGDLASKCAEWGQIDLSRSIVPKIEDPRQRSSKMAELVPILIRAGQIDRAKELALQAFEAANRIPDAQVRAASLSLAAPVLARAGLFDQARDTAMRLENPSARWSSMHSVAVSFLEQGHSDRARDAAIRIRERVSELPSPAGRWAMLAKITEILMKTGAIDQARETALEARREALQVGAPAQQVTWLVMTARTLAEVGLAEPAAESIRSAREIAQTIEDPNARSTAWIALIGPFASIHAVDQAEEAARSAEEAAHRISAPNLQAAILQRLVVAMSKNGLSATARDVATRIPNAGSRQQEMVALLDVYIDTGLTDQAKALMNSVEDAVSRIDHPTDQSIALAKVVEALLRLGDPDKALRNAKAISNEGARSAAFAKVAKALARKHRLREAREVAETCDLPNDRLDAFTTIVGEYTKMSKPGLVKLIDELEGQPVAPRRPGF